MTKIELINIALGRLGESPIQSLDEGSVPARAAAIVYDPARKSALRDYPWSFALKEADLARYEVCDSAFFAYSFALPFDCLRVIAVHGSAEYEVAGMTFYTNTPKVRLKYIADVDDTGLFDSKFAEAFSYKLASELAMPVKGSAELMASYNNAYTTLAQDSAVKSERENRQLLPDNPYVDARFA